MPGRRFRFLARHGRALFVWVVIIVAGIQLWLVPFGAGASSATSNHIVQQGAAQHAVSSAMGTRWTPEMTAALHTHLHLTQHKQP